MEHRRNGAQGTSELHLGARQVFSKIGGQTKLACEDPSTRSISIGSLACEWNALVGVFRDWSLSLIGKIRGPYHLSRGPESCEKRVVGKVELYVRLGT